MNYTTALQAHYEGYFGIKGKKLNWELGPTEKLHSEFYILEFKPNKLHNMWAYCTCGMSLERYDDYLTELVVYSPKQDNVLIEILTLVASYHRNADPIDLHDTVNIGKPWLDNSRCDHGFISLPYLDGEPLEKFSYDNKEINCYWFIPITETERNYKMKNGYEALEDLFEESQFNYLDPYRPSLVN